MTEKTSYVCDVCGKEYLPHPDARARCFEHEKDCAKEKIEQLITKYKPHVVLYVVTWYNYDANDPTDRTLMINLFLNYTAAANFRDEWLFGSHSPKINALELNYAKE